MQIICWNIQTNNAKNIQPAKIADAVNQKIDKGEPWLLAILENKSDAKDVASQIRAAPALNGEWVEVVDAGGESHTKEYVLLIGGGGCICKSAKTDEGWKKLFDKTISDNHNQMIGKQKEKYDDGRKFRQSTIEKGEASVLNVIPWESSKCRNPVVVEVGTGVTTHKFGFVHSPGPREKQVAAGPYAHIYFESVFKSLDVEGLDGLMGDFNIYGSEPIDFKDYSLGPPDQKTKGTTFKKSLDTLGDSRLDRVYLKSQYACHSKLALVESTKDVSDHAGLRVELIDCKTRCKKMDAKMIAQEAISSDNNNNNNDEIHLTETVAEKRKRSDEDASNIPDGKKEKEEKKEMN